MDRRERGTDERGGKERMLHRGRKRVDEQRTRIEQAKRRCLHQSARIRRIHTYTHTYTYTHIHTSIYSAFTIVRFADRKRLNKKKSMFAYLVTGYSIFTHHYANKTTLSSVWKISRPCLFQWTERCIFIENLLFFPRHCISICN